MPAFYQPKRLFSGYPIVTSDRPSVYDIFVIWVQFTGFYRKEEVRF